MQITHVPHAGKRCAGPVTKRTGGEAGMGRAGAGNATRKLSQVTSHKNKNVLNPGIKTNKETDMKTLLINDGSVAPESFIGTRAEFESAFADSLKVWFSDSIQVWYCEDDAGDEAITFEEFVEMTLDAALSPATYVEINEYPRI